MTDDRNNPGAADDAAPTSQPPRAVERVSPFLLIGEFMARVHALLQGIAAGAFGGDVMRETLSLCGEIQSVCEMDADAVLGAIHLDRHGKYIARHPIHCAVLCELVGRRQGYTEENRRTLMAAALTANAGMLELQHRLHAQREPLDTGQEEAVRAHPERGAALLREAGVKDEKWLRIVSQHHEKLDGSGYPAQMRGDEVIVEARILQLADIYHARTSERAYRRPLTPTDALRRVFLSKGKEIDEGLAHAFIKELGIYPPGSVVRLFNGEIAVVTHRGREGTAPRVGAFVSPRGAPYARPHVRDARGREYIIKESLLYSGLLLPDDFLPLWGYGWRSK